MSKYPKIQVGLSTALLGLSILTVTTPGLAASKPGLPNIINMVVDDTGIDQYRIFGFGGKPHEIAKTPNIDALARAGIRFRNAWSQPSCGPTRASILNGRYTIRTGMLSAPAPSDLPNSQTSPYEFMIPKILRQKNYVSAVIGKMHQSTYPFDESNLPYLNETMRVLGFDYFEGYLEGGPSPIDTTAGGVAASGTYSCGFVPTLKDNPTAGADSGACVTANGGCTDLSTASVRTPGRSCMEQGGILVPNAACNALPSDLALNFSIQNGHYTGNWIINKADGVTTETQPPSDARARGFKTQQEVTRAVAWINQQQKQTRPWMVSIGLSAIHEPIQQSPTTLVSAGSPETDAYNCLDQTHKRELATQMVEAIDHEVGRLLVETGLAKRNADGSLSFHLEAKNTYVVFTSDNGTWTTSVRDPFDDERAKGTPYQTGVWVPLIIAGPNVKAPGRQVNHMVNLTDLYTFFGEVAGIDVRKVVPKYRQLDSRKLMPYLLNPKEGAIRTTNYTLQGNNLRASSTVSYPCLLESMNQCTYSLPDKQVCADQGGKWYGPDGVVTPRIFTSCCEVNQENGENYLSSITATGIRNSKYKLVRQVSENCQNGVAVEPPDQKDELFRINQNPVNPQLDTAGANLLDRHLTKEQKRNYVRLAKNLEQIEKSAVDCPGDGNMDRRVDETDLVEWEKFAATAATSTTYTPNGGGQGSWYDFGGPDGSTRPDGKTDDYDKKIIEDNQGRVCK